MSDAEIFQVSMRAYELRLDWPALIRKSEKAYEIQDRQLDLNDPLRSWVIMIIINI